MFWGTQRLLAIGAVGVLLAACAACGKGGTAAQSSTSSSPTAFDTAQFDAAVAAGIAPESAVPGRLAAVIAPDAGVVLWEGAAGIADRETGDPLRADDTVRLGSLTRTFTAATVLRLVEKRALGVDDPIRDLLSPETVAILEGGGYDVDAITVRHLLTHTSGLPDYRAGDGAAPTPNSPYLAAVLENIAYKWTRAEQIQWAIGNYPPAGDPGETFRLSDTGYVLLGEIVERATGMPLGDAAAFQIDYDGLGMVHTWWEVDEAQPAGTRRVHQERGADDVFDVDPRADVYGGGGISSSMGDVARFFDALLSGRVFAESSTLHTMLTIPETNQDVNYAMGIQREEIDGHDCWGHDGFWGMAVISCPADHVTIAVSVNDAAPEDPSFDAQADAATLLALVG
jgi:D-alanyl-D-alanine carboxypeptidase